MGACDCSKKSPIPHEDFVRETVGSLKITQTNYRALKKRLIMLCSERIKFDKQFMRENFSSFFYEKDEKENDKVHLHSKIYDYFYSYLEKETTVYKMLLLLFPLLKKSQRSAFDFADILINIYDKYLTFDNIYNAFSTIFEFYSFQLNQLLKLNVENTEIQKSLTDVNTHIFHYRNIQKFVNTLSLKFNVQDSETLLESKTRFWNTYDSQKVFLFEEIRICLIESYDQQS